MKICLKQACKCKKKTAITKQLVRNIIDYIFVLGKKTKNLPWFHKQYKKNEGVINDVTMIFYIIFKKL